MSIDRIAMPEPGPNDVLVQVKACGVVPNLQRVVSNFFVTETPDRKAMPPTPAIFGLDPAGVIVKTGERVRRLPVGQRVYVNPARSCGGCRMCRSGYPLDCPDFTFQGYFGRSQDIMRDYPYGGLCQYITAPVSSIVCLQDKVSFEQAARLGYLGTAYSALKKLGTGPGQSVLVNGISGMLGLCAALLALAMGANRVLGTGRNLALLERVKALAPERIHVVALRDEDGPEQMAQWARQVNDGAGVDGMIDCLPPGAPASAMLRALHTLRRGGKAANVGAVIDTLPLNTFWLMTNKLSLFGSVWFTTEEGEEMVAMAQAGVLDLRCLEHRVSPLARINEVLAGEFGNVGGFTNVVIDPQA